MCTSSPSPTLSITALPFRVLPQVRAIIGATYMLTQDEELWAKELPPAVEELLAEGKDPLADRSDRSRPGAGLKRDKTRVVTYRVPHNAAVQIYDYKDKKARSVGQQGWVWLCGRGGAVSMVWVGWGSINGMENRVYGESVGAITISVSSGSHTQQNIAVFTIPSGRSGPIMSHKRIVSTASIP